MERIQGGLTPVQLEIMEVVWAGEPQGATVGEIWQTIRSSRPVARTTVLNLVDRLQKRGWLKRRKDGNGFRYVAAAERRQTKARLAQEFVESFFDGSTSNLVMSLIHCDGIEAADVDRLRRLLEDQPETGEGGGNA